MAIVQLAKNWRRPSPRTLWLGLAILVVLHSLVVGGLTQGQDVLNTLLVWGGALVVLEVQGSSWRPQPSRISLWAGGVVLVIVLWRSQQLVTLDATSHVLPLLAGLGLALLAAPALKLGPFRTALVILAVLPLMQALGKVIPTDRLSLLTARVTQVLLHLSGVSAEVQGNVVRLSDGAVQIAGPCSGSGMVTQLVGVGLIFGLAFPMRYRWQNVVMVALAPLLAVLANGLRIGLLALLTSSQMPNKLLNLPLHPPAVEPGEHQHGDAREHQGSLGFVKEIKPPDPGRAWPPGAPGPQPQPWPTPAMGAPAQRRRSAIDPQPAVGAQPQP